MDSERVILVAGITAIAAVVGTFILWGPSTAIRPKRKGAVIGLQNLGLTCYLNSLLQAMASCHYFVEWLNIQENNGEVATAMRKLLNVLCGNTQPLPEEEYFVSPIDVVNALHHSGWKITNSQQDVHELLCNLITILEEEAHKSCVDLTISVDAVSKSCGEMSRISSKTKPKIGIHQSDGDNGSSNSSSSGSICNYFVDNGTRIEENADADTSSSGFDASHADLSNVVIAELINGGGSICCEGDAAVSNRQNRRLKSAFDENRLQLRYQQRPNFDNRIRTKMKSMFSQRWPRIAHDLSQSPRPSPFRGYLTNKIECTRCNYKSVLRYDKFDSISLHLPEPNNQNMHTLNQLLNNFVKNELIGGITCEGCNKNRAPNTELITAPAVKLSRFGKLPACLCIHIVRTSFYEYGVYKRQDYVDFPEYVIMDPYLYKLRRRNDDIFNGAKDTISDQFRANGTSTINTNASGDDVEQRHFEAVQHSSKHLYRLKAVIVHRGSHNDGHFMTYRRGTAASHTQHRCSDARWYLVSDTEVKETTLYNVLTSVAYVLFYEKCFELL